MAWFQSPAGSATASAAASRSPRPRRASPSHRLRIRRRFVSTAATVSPKEIEPIALAVYGPTPGSSESPVTVVGHPRSATCLAAPWSRIARLLYPRPDQASTTAEVSAAARSSTVGNRSMKASNAGITLVTCVCWSMISDTRTRYGSFDRLHGRSRRCSPYHARRAWFRAATSARCPTTRRRRRPRSRPFPWEPTRRLRGSDCPERWSPRAHRRPSGSGCRSRACRAPRCRAPTGRPQR